MGRGRGGAGGGSVWLAGHISYRYWDMARWAGPLF